MGKYSVQGWQYWPDRREGQYISSYCMTQKEYNNIFIIIMTLLSWAVRGGGERKEKGREKNVNTGIRTQPYPGRFVSQSADLTAPPLKLKRPSKASLRL